MLIKFCWKTSGFMQIPKIYLLESIRMDETLFSNYYHPHWQKKGADEQNYNHTRECILYKERLKFNMHIKPYVTCAKVE